MNDTSLNENLQNITVDPEQLKITVQLIKKYSFDLQNAKKKADEAWNICKNSLGENITKDIDAKKNIIQKEFEKGIEDLEKYANQLNSVSDIWKETEIEIISRSKRVDEILSGIKNGLFDIFNSNNK